MCNGYSCFTSEEGVAFAISSRAHALSELTDKVSGIRGRLARLRMESLLVGNKIYKEFNFNAALGALAPMLAKAISIKKTSINPHHIYMLDIDDVDRENLNLLVSKTLGRTLRSIRNEGQRRTVTEYISSYLLSYVYGLVICSTLREREGTNSSLEKILYPAILEHMKVTLMRRDGTPYMRGRVFDRYARINGSYDQILTEFYAKNVKSKRVSVDDIRGLSSQAGEVHTIPILFKRIEKKNPKAVQEFINKYPMFTWYEPSFLLKFAEKYPTAGVVETMNVRRTTTTSKKLNDFNIFVDVISRIPAGELVKRKTILEILEIPKEGIPFETMERIMSIPSFTQKGNWAMKKFLHKHNKDEKTLISAILFPELIEFVATSPLSTERVLGFVNRVNEFQNLGLDDILLSHPNQSIRYIKKATQVVNGYEATALTSPALTAAEAIGEIQKAPHSDRPALCAGLALRHDLTSGHVHYIVKNGNDDAQEALRSNQYVVLDEHLGIYEKPYNQEECLDDLRR